MKTYPKPDLIYVGIQGLLLLFYVIPFKNFQVELNSILVYCGVFLGIIGLALILLAILQLNKNLTPFPTPVQEGRLIKTGLYSWVRHPIYTGIIIGSIGFALADQSYLKLGLAGALWVLFYFKSRYEENLLLSKYPEYLGYRDHTGRFFPKI